MLFSQTKKKKSKVFLRVSQEVMSITIKLDFKKRII